MSLSDLGFRLLALQDPADNQVLSPWSLAVALAMAADGADGETLDQMRTVLGLGDRDAAEVFAPHVARLAASSDEGTRLRPAQQLVAQTGYPFDPAYLARVGTAYDAPVTHVDFAHDADAARDVLNAWVDAETEGRVPNLLPPDSLGPDTRLVLVNALAFTGVWSARFDARETFETLFHAPEGDVRVPMMSRAGLLEHAEGSDVEMVRLRFGNWTYALTVWLPDDPGHLPTADSYAALRADLERGTRRLSLPRFSVRPDATLQLREALSQLGMPKAFDAQTAEFPRMAQPERAIDELFVEQVYQRARVEVTEDGCEAAAGSAVSMRTRGGAPVRPPVTLVDRPFTFAIEEVATGLVLFLGRVVDPS
jgi:serpin B